MRRGGGGGGGGRRIRIADQILGRCGSIAGHFKRYTVIIWNGMSEIKDKKKDGDGSDARWKMEK